VLLHLVSHWFSRSWRRPKQNSLQANSDGFLTPNW